MGNQVEIIVIGGGITGLAIALQLHQQGVTVQVLTRSITETATTAAAGMLAPQAEEIPPGALQDLCLLSRSLYQNWTAQLTMLTGLETGYWNCGIMAPRYHQIDRADWQSPTQLQSRLPRTTLSTEVAGGFWFAADGQVDNRALYLALQRAVALAGIEILPNIEVIGFVSDHHQIDRLQTNQGAFRARHYILATGAWSGQLVPVPVIPRKGQMLALQVPTGETLPLETVLFGEEVYIVPRRNGRIVVGSTSEDVGFLPGNTPGGIDELWQRAIRLCPSLANYPIQEKWWGFRPTTPDEMPLLGESPFENLTLATGHHRNGILLAPATAQIVVDHVLAIHQHPLLDHFSYRRFAGQSILRHGALASQPKK